MKPEYTANKLNITDKVTLEPALKYSPLCNKVRVSKLKDEKVVYPPQIPTMINFCILGDITTGFPVNTKAATNPITKDPITLTIMVPQGKSLPKKLLAIIVHQYLTIPPRALPKAMYKYVIIG